MNQTNLYFKRKTYVDLYLSEYHDYINIIIIDSVN